jgi:hypothetical protein
MSYAPQTLSTARSYVIDALGVPANSVGIVGNEATHFSGYHLGWDRIRANYGWGDYSVSESSRDANPTDGAMALDIGMFSKGVMNLRHLSLWLVAQCAAGAPDTKDIREIIYSPDGRVVKRWDRLGKRSSGDGSHLTHTHISYFRDSEKRDKTSLFRRYVEGEDDMELSDQVPLSAWIRELGGDLGKSLSVQTLLGSGYGHSREAKQLIKNEVLAGQAAILAAVAGASAPDIQKVVKAELDKAAATERTERAAEREALIGPMAEAVAGLVDHTLDTNAVEAALRRVLGSLDGE